MGNQGSRRAQGDDHRRNKNRSGFDPQIQEAGFVIARGPIATVEIGIELKILAKAMIKQIESTAVSTNTPSKKQALRRGAIQASTSDTERRASILLSSASTTPAQASTGVYAS